MILRIFIAIYLLISSGWCLDIPIDFDINQYDKIEQPGRGTEPVSVIIKLRDGRILSGLFRPNDSTLVVSSSDAKILMSIDTRDVVDWRKYDGLQSKPIGKKPSPVETAKRDIKILKYEYDRLELKRKELIGLSMALKPKYEKLEIDARRMDRLGNSSRAEYDQALKKIVSEIKRLKDQEINILEVQCPAIVSKIEIVQRRILECSAIIQGAEIVNGTSTIAIDLPSSNDIKGKKETTSGIINRSIQATALIAGPNASGSGFLVNHNGDMLTNRHVIESNSFEDGTLNVQFDSGVSNKIIKYRVKFVFADIDVAVLSRVEAGIHENYLVLSNTAGQINRDILILGYPLALKIASVTNTTENQISITKGTISSHRRDGSGIKFIGVDAKANHGNSGGPVIDADTGEVYGILTMAITDNGRDGDSSILAIPSTVILKRISR